MNPLPSEITDEEATRIATYLAQGPDGTKDNAKL